MQPLIHIIERGMRFIRSNPQIIYTFILAILIPVAFIATGEQFLHIAKKNQDRLERGRIGAMQEEFSPMAKKSARPALRNQCAL